MLVAYKYRLYPTDVQKEFLHYQLREACDLYNAALEERRGAWKICRKSIYYCDQANQLKAMRAEALINVANFSCCQDVLRRVDKAYKAFFRRVRHGEKPGFPRFRSRRRYDSITFPSYGDGCRLNAKLLRIQGAGEIKVKLHRAIKGRIKTVTIKREINKWFVVFSVEREVDPLPKSNAEIGIDVGLNRFAALSDSTEVANPRFMEGESKRLKRAQRKLCRCKKGSNNRRKAAIIVAKIHRKIQNQRSDFQHNLSRSLVNNYGMIAVEDLNYKGLCRGRFARSVHDAGWSSFFQKLSYKAAEAGRELVKVDPRGTSQACLCGASVPKTLADRRHRCHSCGLDAPRDVVSAQIILQRARIEPSRRNVEGC